MSHYDKPPIVEAVLCIYLESQPKLTGVAELEKMCASISDRYPTKMTRRRFQSKIKFDDSGVCMGTEPSDLGLDGFICKSPDEKQIVQICFDRFVFNRLAPYEGWDTFSEEAIKLWESYAHLIGPLAIKKISLRNINKIEFSLEKPNEINKYLLLSPQHPKELDTTLKEFSHETVFTLNGIQINVIQSSKINEIGSTVYFLDIESSKNIEKNIDKQTLIKQLQYLREAKNNVFENSISDEIKKDFK